RRPEGARARMTTPGLVTPDQQAAHKYGTRGMNKSAVPFREQILAGRSEQQTRDHRPRLCIRCEAERHGSYPVCTRCRERSEA
ncbi:MAG TPA: hypothetical protein VFT50_11620, partial [Baekduia sp.]|nr:hypothetical protein [Baekduia sp.]